MAYVRQRGDQLAIVHGVRNPHTKKVEQQILFTLYSKAEALEAVSKTNGPRLRSLLEHAHPTIRFDWQEICRGIEQSMSTLPETYDVGSTRLRGQFRSSLLGFARQLILTDPQTLAASSQLIAEHRGELEYLRELIDWRLETPEEAADEWNGDNEFFWRFATRDPGVPPDIEEHAADLYEKHEFERAAVAFRALTAAFENYAEGHNYLGLIALEQQRLEDAIAHFRKTMEVGRGLFPKKIAKNRWWSDLATRPYMRGLQNLALTLNQAGRYDEALEACDRLQRECHDDITAAAHRGSAHLNLAHWQQAHDAAWSIHHVSRNESLIASLAAFELGRQDDAKALFVHAALNNPRTVAMVIDAKLPRTSSRDEAQDHNLGVSMSRSLGGYREKRRPVSRRFFSDLWKSEQLSQYRKELADVTRQWREDRKNEARAAYDRMMRLRSWEFATEVVRPAPNNPGVGLMRIGKPASQLVH